MYIKNFLYLDAELTDVATELEFMDEFSFECIIRSIVIYYVKGLVNSDKRTGLQLNSIKCEIVTTNFEMLIVYNVVKDF